MSATHIHETETIPAAEPMTRDEIIASVNAARREGVGYTFELYRGLPCEHCGELTSPLMRFARNLEREAWIMGTPDDGSNTKLVCAVTIARVGDNAGAATLVEELEDIVRELNQ